MKKRRIVLLCLVGLLCLTACRLPGQSSGAPASTSDPFSFTETEQGLPFTTPYFTMTFPKLWKDNLAVRYSENKNSIHYRFVDPVSEADYGGHYFTLSLHQDPIEAAEICCYTGTYLGVLKTDLVYSLIITTPTDLPVGEDRVELYQQLQKTRSQVINTLVPSSEANYIAAGAANYQERAAMLTTQTSAREVAQQFAKDTGVSLTYVGLCPDLLVYEADGQTLPRDKYTHYLYRDQAGTPYLIPLFFADTTHTVIPTVFRVDNFPHISPIWSIEQTEFDRITQRFLKNSGTADQQYCLKDLDGEGIPELLVLENTTISVYSLENGSAIAQDQFDSVTATMSYHFWYGIDYPGVFTVNVGGGKTHYGYLSYLDGTLTHRFVAEKDSPDPLANLPLTIYDESFVEILDNPLPELSFQPVE